MQAADLVAQRGALEVRPRRRKEVLLAVREIVEPPIADPVVNQQETGAARLDRQTVFVQDERRAEELAGAAPAIDDGDERAAPAHHALDMRVDSTVRRRIDKE